MLLRMTSRWYANGKRYIYYCIYIYIYLYIYYILCDNHCSIKIKSDWAYVYGTMPITARLKESWAL